MFIFICIFYNYVGFYLILYVAFMSLTPQFGGVLAGIEVVAEDVVYIRQLVTCVLYLAHRPKLKKKIVQK